MMPARPVRLQRVPAAARDSLTRQNAILKEAIAMVIEYNREKGADHAKRVYSRF